MPREKSCGAIVISEDNKYLIAQHGAGHWDLPKGHVEGEETEEKTALREVFEETGLKVRILDGFREEIHYYPKPGVFKTVVYFVALAVSKKLKLDELIGYKWLPYEEAVKQLDFKNSKELLQKAHKFLQEL